MRSKKRNEEWNVFGLLVQDYNVNLEWGFNSAIYDKNRRSDDSPVYESHLYLHLECVVLWPEEQEGDIYHITLSEPIKDWFLGPPTDFNVKLGEFAAKDKEGNRKYRTYKDREVGIYDPPFEIGMIDKQSGEYSASANVEREILSQMINLVLNSDAIYVHLVELIKPKPGGRRGKNRWVRSVSVNLGDDGDRALAKELEAKIQALERKI